MGSASEFIQLVLFCVESKVMCTNDMLWFQNVITQGQKLLIAYKNCFIAIQV